MADNKRNNTLKWLCGGLAVLLVIAGAFALTGPSSSELEQVRSEAEKAKADAVTAAISGLLTPDEAQKQADEAVLAKVAELEAQKVEEEPTSAEAAEGYVIDELSLGDSIIKLLTHSKIAKLFKGELSFDDDGYDVEEELSFNSDFKVLYSAVNDKDLGEEVVLGTTEKGAIEYSIVFNDPVKASDVTTNEPLYVNFLGKALEIIDVDTDSFNLQDGTKVSLRVGEEPKEVAPGVKVSVVNVGVVSSIVKVNDEEKIIQEGTSKTFAGGWEVKVEALFNSDVLAEKTAYISVGKDNVITVESGDSLELFGEPKDESDADWVWELSTSTISGDLYLNKLSAVHNQRYDDADEKVLRVGEFWSLPNNFGKLLFESLTDVSYMTLNGQFDKVEDDTGADLYAFVLKASESDGFLVGTEESDEVYLSTSGLYFVNDDNDVVQATGTTFKVVHEDTELDASLTGGNFVLNDGFANVFVDLTLSATAEGKLGLNEDDAEPSDVEYGTTELGTRDDSVRTTFGLVLDDVENNAEKDEVVLKVPSEQLEATLKVVA